MFEGVSAPDQALAALLVEVDAIGNVEDVARRIKQALRE